MKSEDTQSQDRGRNIIYVLMQAAVGIGIALFADLIFLANSLSFGTGVTGGQIVAALVFAIFSGISAVMWGDRFLAILVKALGLI